MDENKNKKESDDLFIRQGHLLQRLKLSEVVWIKSEGNYCTFSTTSKKHVLKISLMKVLEIFPNDAFAQIHRSYAVRIDQITSIDIQTNMVFIESISLPIGRKFKQSLLDRINLI